MPFYRPMRECFVGYNLHPCHSFRETHVLHDVLPIFMPHLYSEQPFTKTAVFTEFDIFTFSYCLTSQAAYANMG